VHLIYSFKENQLDAHFILSIFRQTPLHVSGVSIAHHQEVHRMDIAIGTYCVWRNILKINCASSWVSLN